MSDIQGSAQLIRDSLLQIGVSAGKIMERVTKQIHEGFKVSKDSKDLLQAFDNAIQEHPSSGNDTKN
jgi:hypothetical protein